MKKSLVALAILAAAGVASAQSSVTLFGTVDVNYAHGSGSTSSKSAIGSNGLASSAIGFRGTEDLGGGMSASFHLEASVFPDNGSGGSTTTNNQTTGGLTVAGVAATPATAALNGAQGLTFDRRSTLSLASGLGELRLGRDYTPQFWNQTVFDPFGTNGVGTSQAMVSRLGGLTSVRASNGVGYFLPGNLGGFYGQIQHYLGENNSGAANSDDGKGTGVRLGWGNGPINVAVATSSTSYVSAATTGDTKVTNLGGSYDFGVAKVMALVTRDKVESTPTTTTGKGALIGAHVPMGAGLIRMSYSTYKTDAATPPKTKKIALGYVHNLSKRTALYTTFARVTNSGGATVALNGATTAANERSTGYDFGIKHSF